MLALTLCKVFIENVVVTVKFMMLPVINGPACPLPVLSEKCLTSLSISV